MTAARVITSPVADRQDLEGCHGKKRLTQPAQTHRDGIMMDGHTSRPTNAGDRRGCGLGFILAVLGEQLNKHPAKIWKELGACRGLGNSALVRHLFLQRAISFPRLLRFRATLESSWV